MKKLLKLTLASIVFSTTIFGFTTNISANTGSTSSSLQSAQITSTTQNVRSNIIRTGHRFLGVPYRLGAEYETSRRFDCSSFTQYVYKRNGISLPRGARAQYNHGVKVARNDLRPGDLVFFSTKATLKYSRYSVKRIGHVGIYAGKNRVLHTYGKGGVKYNTMSSGWWDKHYVGAVRVIR
ncbi:C40 family peptidase [Ammoniphilus sp. CFH 90114]|uniref:C40 family peptidase n=1 Tax=Ammoniphilus sp. CFH 90114 TaxID=2493665 RepID=UPI00100E2D2A|nr:C40 family peptidase [Ammoniphilus sp. CFH 90114]RXT15268.1 NlpC/P60 family protein [Ammoniphilus sp. CFH 90114]